MSEERVKLNLILENRLPEFVVEEFPLVSEFLSQYYVSVESKGLPGDIIQNIDKYVNVDNITNLIEYTTLSSEISEFDKTIQVSSTDGFPSSYGLLRINDEIITYTGITTNSFTGCVRGFSGITSFESPLETDHLTFSTSNADTHQKLSKVENLSILFLKYFFRKLKTQILPGFEDRDFYKDLNESLFTKLAPNFYKSKGTDASFRMLFGALYGTSVEVIKPSEYLIKPSDAQYQIFNDLVVESVEGDPFKLLNLTLTQDADDFFLPATGTVTNVEKIFRNGKNYYTVSVDYDYNRDINVRGTTQGKFSIHPQTVLLSEIPINSTYLDVDSTVGFPNSGTLIADYGNGFTLEIQYSSKNLTQFLGCSGIVNTIPELTKIKLNSFAYSYYNNEIIKIRILGVLSKLDIPEGVSQYSKDDIIKIKTLGAPLKEEKFNNWFFNIPTKYKLKTPVLINPFNKTYNISTYDANSFRVKDSITIISPNGINQVVSVESTNKFDNSFTVTLGENAQELVEGLTYYAKKNISKVNYTSLSHYNSNVQNVYFDGESLYVSSPSLPGPGYSPVVGTARNIKITNVFDNKLSINETKNFYTGDSVVYNPSPANNLGLSTGVYFINKIDSSTIQLSRSKNNIFNNEFVAITGSGLGEILTFSDFVDDSLQVKTLESQKLIRKISDPKNTSNYYETLPGCTGIFINGVELLNYKSKDTVYYGPIESITPTSSGSDYDIITPPSLSILDKTGSGAVAYCSVIGSLDRLDIIDPGFDYVEPPTIEITGGNGTGAIAEANLVSFDHVVEFSAQSLVNLTPSNSVQFNTPHKFRDFEEVIYITNGQTSVGGLSTNSSYFVSVISPTEIKLHSSFSNASIGINTIPLTSYGEGIHIFKSRNKKKKIGSITIKNSGENYQNRLTSTYPIGINTSKDTIYIKNHGYKSGEIIVYTPTDTPIGGLSSSSSYYVTSVDNNHFKLSPVGVSTLGITTSFYYDTNQYINITSSGTGIHKFNYPPIKVKITGKIGLASSNLEQYNATVNPIFRGEINSVFVQDGGYNYGSEDIINYNRQPEFGLNTGSGIVLKPIVSSGKIVSVIINSSGSDYTAAPKLEVVGDGLGAVLTPVLSNGQLIGVNIISGGLGYNQNNTFINVVASGKNAKFQCNIKSWSINLVEKFIEDLSDINKNDGILYSSNYGLQFTHAYAPRQLRKLVESRKDDGKYVKDLVFENEKEIDSPAHSPIIGWAYDGNPIYGPYGYETQSGGKIKTLQSGYKLIDISNNQNRPNILLYPNGLFVEDYEYTGEGDLDEHNGRFSITPEYPNGIYAYFTTVTSKSIQTFQQYKKPVFPYVIGSSYKSDPIEFNFNKNSNQDDIDVNITNWRRNTTPYNIFNDGESYEYILDIEKIKRSISTIKSSFPGSVEFVGILTGGTDYKVGDELTFNKSTNNSAKAKISLVKGKEIDQISLNSSSFEDVEFYPFNSKFIGFTTEPHNYLNSDFITITGKYDYNKIEKISVKSNVLTLATGIGSALDTGLITYLNVSGNISYPTVRENDIYQIQDEQIKVLNIDPELSRIRILRNQNGTIGITSYFAGDRLYEKTRKFEINIGISTFYNFNINKEFYFNPGESVGVGTSSGVGIVTTIYFSNPGAGITQITIPTRSIYIKNHGLGTGDSLKYFKNGGSSIQFSNDGINNFSLSDGSILYAYRISTNLIGISTESVVTPNNILYFTNIGSGINHSFITNRQDNFTAEISKNTVTVTTNENHDLSLHDKIQINVKSGLSTSCIVKYNDFNRRILVDSRSFSSINTTDSTIFVEQHGYYTGQKIVFNSLNPPAELNDEGIYYVVVISKNKFKLASSYYDATNKISNTINVSTSASGTISPINPPIKVLKNQSLVFDLSDPSLSFNNGSQIKSSFDFRIYRDSLFTDEYYSSSSTSIFEVVKEGNIGIDSTAKVKINFNENVPNILYYKLIPINLKQNFDVKKQIIVDNNIIDSNKIVVNDSVYSGTYSIIGISTNTFDFNIPYATQSELSEIDNVEYYTDSSLAIGPIQQIKLIDIGKYDKLPGISSITSVDGKNAILEVNSNNIGRIKNAEINDIGFDYSCDFSIRPLGKLPDILKLETLSSLDYINIISFGKGYGSIPTLVVIDGVTNEVITDVELSYTLNSTKVNIIKNSNSINNALPIIIPTNNSNGIKIKKIEYDNITNDVTVTLKTSFNSLNEFPFYIGSKVLIEGVSVGIQSTGKGYNSSNYNYSFFTITSYDPKLGGEDPTVTYNLAGYLLTGEDPGTFNGFYSSGRIVPESYLPIFAPALKKGIFYNGEQVISESSVGNVLDWDPLNGLLKVSSIDDFEVNKFIVGKTSGSTGIIKNISSVDIDYIVDSSSERRKGWNKETGFLNNDFQRIHDGNYYQYFSYELKSNIDFNTWDKTVDDLNHTSGFKKFGNLVIETDSPLPGISTEQNYGDFYSVANFSSLVNLNCINDFDLAKENNLIIDNQIKSNEIIFDSRIIQDYIESVGNRVLNIDDISNQFNSVPRLTTYSVVDSFLLSDFRSKKYIASIVDRFDYRKKEIIAITLIYDDQSGFLNQYGCYSEKSLGTFDFSVYGDEGNLLFYPIETEYNNYDIKLFSFTLKDNLSGISTIILGDSVKVETNTILIPQGTSSPFPIIEIDTRYRSSKLLIQIGEIDSTYYEYQELSYIHDDSEVYLLEYGKITTNVLNSNSSSGIGTYNAYISGSNVVIELIPYNSTEIDYSINSINICISNSDYSSIGSETLSASKICSNSILVPSSPTPSENAILTYSNDDYDSAYLIVVIEDKTNNNYQVSEVLMVSNELDCYITEYGLTYSNYTLGSISASVSGNDATVYFTPLENIEVDIKVFAVDVGLDYLSGEILLNNGSLNYDHGSYIGRINDIKKSFILTHKNLPIFEREFDGENSDIVDIAKNTIKITNHFYVTGEEIVYSYPENNSSNAIGIAATVIPGIGLTDKLPSKIYIVNNGSNSVQVSASSSEALNIIPKVLQLTSVGIGSTHIFTAKNQNSKALITIDNVIQSPIVSTSTTTIAIKKIESFDSEIYVSNPLSFYVGDLIKVDDEIMKIGGVGIGSTNKIDVVRSWLGTDFTSHPILSIVTKLNADYNIIGNTIHFSDPPYGKVFDLTNNLPDQIDYVGISSGSSFNGRVFMRNAKLSSLNEPYHTNYIFDDISDQFTGVDKSFTLKVQGQDITGISTGNGIVLINEIFQQPSSQLSIYDYNLTETLGITSITFTGEEKSTNYDINTSSIPRRGIIVSVGSTQGFGYQPLVSAGGTAIISISGTVQSISIGNSGSGYRSGIQNPVRVGVKTYGEESQIEYIGIASVVDGNIVSIGITNPGSGYNPYDPPVVIFDSPLSYSNIPLIYSNQSTSGSGDGATVDIIVGQGSSVISFEIQNTGYSYEPGEILTVSFGGTTGIPTTTNFKEFQITVNEIFQDKFSAWRVGDLQVMDSIDFLFDGIKKRFPILIEGNRTSIRAKPGSSIEIGYCLLVFINDTLQIPGESYIFNGGSILTFTEAPKQGDTCKILFYKGTSGVDTEIVDILETIKIGDTVTLKSDNFNFNQDERLVVDIVSSDTLDTNLYSGPGISEDENLLRPLTWCMQTEDLIINGKPVSKDRIIYEPYIYPITNTIKNIENTSDSIFVESVKGFFDSEREYIHNGTIEIPQNKILIISQETSSVAIATAQVSASGTIFAINLVDNGVGYTTAPTISISNPIGIGTSGCAKGVSTIMNGVVSNISIIEGGFGYNQNNPPLVLFESPKSNTEIIDNISYEGDYGIITGINTTSVGIASTAIVFDLYIPSDSVLRDSRSVKVGVATTGISGIQTGYYFVVKNSNVGNGVTSLDNDSNIVGVGTQFLDNIYQAISVSVGQTAVAGVGITNVTKVMVSVSDYNNLIGIGFSGFYGDYSWGKISTPYRKKPKSFKSYANTGGISTSPIVQRYNRLKYIGYSTT